MPGSRAILHVDMDAFFAAIEQLDHPELRGKPILVGYDGPRGVVTTASYEARPAGCRSAQPMAVAKRLCPQAIVVPVRGARYREISRRVFEILRRYTPLVEGISIDEAFLDVTGSQRLFGDAPTIARAIKQAIRAETQLTASIGVAPNKFLAKLASDLEKPDGLTIVDESALQDWLDPLPISRMWGVGPATEEALHRMAVFTFRDLRRLSCPTLHHAFGEFGDRLHRLARGIDDRPVTVEHEVKSISHEQTFGHDLPRPDDVRRVLMQQTERVGRRLRRNALTARCVTIKVRYGDFQTITRSHTLDEPTDRTDELWAAARDLFDAWAGSSFQPVRLIGMGASRFGGLREETIELFPDPRVQRRRQLDRATDAIRDRFGADAISRGEAL